MEVGSGWTPKGRPKLRWSDIIRNDMETGVKIEEAQDAGNVEIENSMRRPQIGKRPKKKIQHLWFRIARHFADECCVGALHQLEVV